ncbi:MAG: sensor domain-containing diguanylate cyclase [Pseudomonadota bacterium]
MASSINSFPCGCVVTNKNREIVFANAYLEERFGRPVKALIGERVETLLSPASHIFCDSFVFPLIIKEGVCEETQLTLVSEAGVRIPVIANVRRSRDPDDVVYWSLFSAESRDKLYQELVDARSRLEGQRRDLKEMSDTDSLTGMLNRRAFDREFDRVLADTKTSGASVAVLMLDIDHFKSINDDLGHDVGDRVLQALGACITKTCRAGELAARYGGEEFIFVLTHVESSDVMGFAERLQSAIRQLRFEGRGITASMGIHTTQAHPHMTCSEVKRLADQALYEAKNTGRDKISVYRDHPVNPAD